MNEKLKVYLIKINYEIQKNTLKEFLNISIINHCMKYKLCRKQYDSLYAFYILRKIYLNEFNIDINNFKLKENEYGKHLDISVLEWNMKLEDLKKEYDNENDNSSVIYTKLNNHKFLFMGDARVEVEKDL